MSINVKKYTKDQMAKMVEDAQEAAKKVTERMGELQSRVGGLEAQARILKAKNATLTEQIDQMNGEAINKANEIEKLKADADVLRNKLADTEAALGRANAEVSRMTVGCRQVEEERDYMHQQWGNAEQRANYAEAHPWRNLWAWLKRKMVRHE
jgi:chromosome segregation ATPase